MGWPPHVTVGSIIEDQGKFLVIEEMVQNIPVINFPAGHLEPHETFLQAAIRETHEETGWQTDITHLLSIHKDYAENTGIVYVHLCFVAKAIALDESATLDPGIRQVLWLSYNELMAMKGRMRSQTVFNNLQQYVRGDRFPLSMIYDDGK